MFPQEFVYPVLLSILLGVSGAWGIARYGYLVGLMDHPKERSSHTHITPKGGGVGILIAFVILCLLRNVSWLFWIPASSLAILSFLGDRVELSPKLRLIIQFLLAGLVLLTTDYPGLNPFTADTTGIPALILQALFLPVLIVFLVGTANFYNFMDGINGIAGITGIVAFGLLGIAAWQMENLSIAILSFGITAACLGFLPLNLPKAKVFMGDVGSILLGFVFAGLVLLVAENFTDLICFAGFLLPFYMDEVVTMAERVRKRESLTKPHRTHLYQILANEGKIEHWKVSIGYGIAQFLLGVTLLLAKPYGLLPVFTIICVSFSCFFLINHYYKKRFSI